MIAALRVLSAELERVAGPQHYQRVRLAMEQLELELVEMKKRLAELERREKERRK